MEDWNPWFILLGVIITAASGFFSAKLTGRSSVRTKEIEVDALVYDRAERINNAAFTRLEKQIGDLDQKVKDQDVLLQKQSTDMRELRIDLNSITDSLNAAVTLVEEWMIWVTSGCEGPRPEIPRKLRPHIDPDLIEQYNQSNAENIRFPK